MRVYIALEDFENAGFNREGAIPGPESAWYKDIALGSVPVPEPIMLALLASTYSASEPQGNAKRLNESSSTCESPSGLRRAPRYNLPDAKNTNQLFGLRGLRDAIAWRAAISLW